MSNKKLTTLLYGSFRHHTFITVMQMTCSLSTFSSHHLNADSFCLTITYISCRSPDVLLSIFIWRHLLPWQLLLLCVCARHMGHASSLRLGASRSRAVRESENRPYMAIRTCPLDMCNFTLSVVQVLGVRTDRNEDRTVIGVPFTLSVSVLTGQLSVPRAYPSCLLNTL